MGIRLRQSYYDVLIVIAIMHFPQFHVYVMRILCLVLTKILAEKNSTLRTMKIAEKYRKVVKNNYKKSEATAKF